MINVDYVNEVGDIFLLKGTLLGGIVGLVITFWLCFGSMTVSDLHPPLPPVSVEHCSVGNGNSTFLPNSLNYTNYTSFEFADAISSNENWNGTNDNLPESRFQEVNTVYENILHYGNHIVFS